jgi:Mandelate racemase / muconate lactonizing enzyme, N-terminal domain
MDRMKSHVGFGRRGFLRSAAAMAGAGFWADQTLDAAVQNVNRSSSPSDLKITDLRVAVVKDAPFVCPLIRIDTNQGIHGLGEVRDGASKTYALFLKSRLLGENPCNIDKIFRKIKQFGGDSRQAGGVCGVEMALWDLAGKAYGVPVYQMLGGKFRDKIRCYADTTESHDPKIYGQRLKGRKSRARKVLPGCCSLRRPSTATLRPKMCGLRRSRKAFCQFVVESECSRLGSGSAEILRTSVLYAGS